MTRWIEEFNQSPFKINWSILLEETKKIDADDKTVVTTVEEIARFKKVIVFIEKIISNIDLEITPKSVWSNCAGQTEACLQQVKNYNSNRNESHLVQANEHADNLLTYVRPYMVVPEKALASYGFAIKEFSDEINRNIKFFHDNSLKSRLAISETLEDTYNKKEKIDSSYIKIKELDEYLFKGDEENKPVDEKIKYFVSEIDYSHSEVERIHRILDNSCEAISLKISEYEEKIKDSKNEFNDLLNYANTKQTELEVFYIKIFGRQIEDGEKVSINGLKQELDMRINQLDSFEKEQKLKHKTIFETVEGLLPGATSAGLASAYKSLKDEFKNPIEKYTKIFYFSLLILFITGIIFISDSISIYPSPSWKFVQAKDWTEMFRMLVMRSPIIIPVVWVALFSANRRRQYERLQQEYAHKEALASSYESYKKQLQDLKGENDNMQKELISKAIDAISYNASSTLDEKHTEKSKLLNLFNNLSLEEIRKLVEIAKSKKTIF